MKLKEYMVIKYVLGLVLFIMCGGFYLPAREILGEYTTRFIIALFGIALFFYTRFIKGNSFLKKLDKYVLIIFVVTSFQVFFSKIKYGYSLRDSIIMYTWFLFVFYSYPFLYVFIKERNILRSLSFFSKIEIIMLFLRFSSFALFNYVGINIFPRLLFQYDVWQRNGVQRIEPSVFFGFSLVYWTIQILRTRDIRKVFYAFIVIFMIAFLAMATIARFQTTVALITVFFIVYFKKIRVTTNSIISKTIFILFFFVVIMFSGILNKVISLISVSGSYGMSTSVRISGIEHFFSYFSLGNIITGLGLLNRDYAIPYEILKRNEWSIYYLDDLGVIGCIIQFGLLAILLYYPLYYLSIKTIIKNKRYKRDILYGLAIGIATYLMVSSLLLNVYDYQRLFDLPVYLSLFIYLLKRDYL